MEKSILHNRLQAKLRDQAVQRSFIHFKAVLQPGREPLLLNLHVIIQMAQLRPQRRQIFRLADNVAEHVAK
ncbi:hypothetical protein D3C81_2115840 [compost metagenome]